MVTSISVVVWGHENKGCPLGMAECEPNGIQALPLLEAMISRLDTFNCCTSYLRNTQLTYL